MSGDGRDSESFACQYCQRTFTTKAGRTLHSRRAHESDFHGDNKPAERVKARWSEEEVHRVAEVEAELTEAKVRFINQALHQHFPERTLESIKGMRKTRPGYKDTVKELLKARTCERVPALPPSPAPVAPVRDLSELEAAAEPLKQGRTPDVSADRNTSILPSDPEEVMLGKLQSHIYENRQFLVDQTPDTFMDRASGNECETTVSSEYTSWLKKHDLRTSHKAPRARRSREKKTKSRAGHERARTMKVGVRKVSKRQAKRERYARLQSDWADRQSETAKQIIRGTWGARSSNLPLDKLLPFWKELFEAESKPDTRTPARAYEVKLTLLEVVSENELTKVLRKAKNGAPGPDRIKLGQVLAIPRNDLATHMNLWLWSGVPPEDFKKGATSLIPKVVTVTKPGENRPITLAGMICRVYHRLLAARLEKATNLKSRQRAFTSGDGIAENVALIRGITKYCKDECVPLHVAFIDVAKAFDSVSHRSLLASAYRLGLPKQVTKYVERLYTGITTSLKVGEERCSEIISVNRGIRQGDPLSPILFNSCIDWSLEGISDKIGFRTPEGHVLSHLAFADDIVLFAQTPEGLNVQVQKLASEMEKCGLYLNANKSQTYSQLVDGKKKQWVQGTEPCVWVGGEALKPIPPGETYKYLGTAYAGVRGNPKPQKLIGQGLQHITEAPLKPQQRMVILLTYLIPQIYHMVVLDHVTAGQLGDMDIRIRRTVRRWLKLPEDTPVGFFHAAVKAGGLGIPRLKSTVPAQRAYRFGRLQRSADPITRFVMSTSFMLKLSTYGQAVRREGTQPAPTRAQEKQAQIDELYSSVDGMGLEQFSHTPGVAHDWVRNPTKYRVSGHSYIKLISIRGGVAPTAARLARGRPERNRQCESCNSPETLNHVQQKCVRTHGARITRHDKLVSLVAECLGRRGWEVRREEKLALPDRNLIPDIVALRGPRTAVLDVTVVGDQLDVDSAANNKAEKYGGADLASHLLDQRKAAGDVEELQPVESIGLAWNWRGAVANQTYRGLLSLGCTKSAVGLLCLRAVQGSDHILRFHRRTTFHRYWEDEAAEGLM